MRDQANEVAIIGDLHSFWDDADVHYFDGSDYPALLFTGDLGSSGARDGVRIARSLATVQKQTLVMLGNNDAEEYARITAELHYQSGQSDLLSGPDSLAARQGKPASASACGFSRHLLSLAPLELTVIAARPFAMGASELSFPDALRTSFGVETLAQSIERLVELVDAAVTEHLMFLGHNGPDGLGGDCSSAFGRDFHPDAGDWGDSDLSFAVRHAKQIGRRVLAVVAGHMHRPLKGGGQRVWQLVRDGTLYVNAAHVPRHDFRANEERRHHVALGLTRDGARARDVWVSG